MIQCQKNGHIFLFIGGQSLRTQAQCFAQESQRVPTLHEHCAYANASRITFHTDQKHLVKSGKARTGAEIKASLSAWKD